MRYFLHLAYDGMPFSGWQWQKTTKHTVQHILQQQLVAVLRDETIVVSGCGRTDAGVHASQYFAQIDVWEEIENERFIFKLNKGLHSKISVFEAIRVDDDASVRYGATQRRYDFFVHLKKDPFLHNKSILVDEYHLDIEAMVEATKLINKYDDFEFLCNNPEKHNTTICYITRSELLHCAKTGQLQLIIESNRYIRGMIRILMQCLIDIGRKAITIDDFESYLGKHKEREYKTKAFPQGLYLSKIEYPFLSIPNQSLGYNRLRLDL